MDLHKYKDGRICFRNNKNNICIKYQNLFSGKKKQNKKKKKKKKTTTKKKKKKTTTLFPNNV